MCGSAFTSAHRHHHLDRLVHLVVSLEQTDFGDATSMEELTVEARWLFVRRRDLGDLEETPTTTSLGPTIPALAPADSQNNTATRAGM